MPRTPGPVSAAAAHEAEPKTWMKHHQEHKPVLKKHRLQGGSLNLDPIRVGAERDSAQSELDMWERIKAKSGVPLRIKKNNQRRTCSARTRTR